MLRTCVVVALLFTIRVASFQQLLSGDTRTFSSGFTYDCITNQLVVASRQPFGAPGECLSLIDPQTLHEQVVLRLPPSSPGISNLLLPTGWQHVVFTLPSIGAPVYWGIHYLDISLRNSTTYSTVPVLRDVTALSFDSSRSLIWAVSDHMLLSVDHNWNVQSYVPEYFAGLQEARGRLLAISDPDDLVDMISGTPDIFVGGYKRGNGTSEIYPVLYAAQLGAFNSSQEIPLPSLDGGWTGVIDVLLYSSPLLLVGGSLHLHGAPSSFLAYNVFTGVWKTSFGTPSSESCCDESVTSLAAEPSTPGTVLVGGAFDGVPNTVRMLARFDVAQEKFIKIAVMDAAYPPHNPLDGTDASSYSVMDLYAGRKETFVMSRSKGLFLRDNLPLQSSCSLGCDCYCTRSATTSGCIAEGDVVIQGIAVVDSAISVKGSIQVTSGSTLMISSDAVLTTDCLNFELGSQLHILVSPGSSSYQSVIAQTLDAGCSSEAFPQVVATTSDYCKVASASTFYSGGSGAVSLSVHIGRDPSCGPGPEMLAALSAGVILVGAVASVLLVILSRRKILRLAADARQRIAERNREDLKRQREQMVKQARELDHGDDNDV